MNINSNITYPSIIYKRSNKNRTLKEMDALNRLQWFALNNNYGADSYGNIVKSYRFKREPKLLDIGNANVREEIEKEILKIDPNANSYMDPNEQYSGLTYNTKYHEKVKQIFGNDYDGTIIDETQLQGNSKYPVEELEGPTEIVIWKNFDDLLEEIPTAKGGRKKRKYTIKKRKYTMKRRKTRKYY